MDSNRKLSFCLLLLIIISLVNLGSGSDSATVIVGERSCNGTLGECFFSGGDMEFLGEEVEAGDLLRHYAAGARWLLQSGTKSSNRALQKAPVCNTANYANCVAAGGGSGRCTDYNRCKRSG